jgi:uncharacterized membrane protein YbhN (UPF0104 family)
MTSRMWAWARPIGGLGILALVVWKLGTGPILDGLRTVSGRSVAAAAGIAVVTTVFSAWRWSVVACGLGMDIPLRTAIAAYYRSQFLNTTLPGGVLGDVHRGIRHGQHVGDLGRALRAVAWERLAGQVVQVGLALLVLLTLPSPFRSYMRVVVPVAVVCALGTALLGRVVAAGERRWVRTLQAELHDGLLARRVWPRVTLASVVVVAGHATTFLIATRTAGSTASPAKVIPLAMVVLLAMAVPANIAGWGPREGAAAWVFGSAGLGSAQGVAAATVYGVLVLVASLPGVAVLIISRRRPACVAADSAPRRGLEIGEPVNSYVVEVRGPEGALNG